VIYVEELIGPQTVNTIPPPTAEAFRDHGKLRESLTEGVDAAGEIMEKLEQAGISMKEVTDRLLEEGVDIFAVAFDKLLDAVEKAR
jgi:transaldolase/glucose-6-phosphate isomerase